MKKLLCLLIFIHVFACDSPSQQKVPAVPEVKPGAYQIDEYLPLLKDKKVALFVNHTSLIGLTHIIDSLSSLGINITKVFTPEHGFTGTKSDGEIIEKEATNESFELISLYQRFKKPTAEQMHNIDVLVVDIQEVGVRFYTYSSTMSYLMEACAKFKIPMIVLDRPNPNGSYVDGPVLEPDVSSFIGLHPIALVHGMTIGELAKMINEEGWLADSLKCELDIIKIDNWDHNTTYSLPIRPSPNLPNDLSVALYPSLALFEGTIVSVGRGTDKQFQIIGHPDYPDTAFSFIPQPNEGSSTPPLQGEVCYGLNLTDSRMKHEFTLKYLIHFFDSLKGQTNKPFFNAYFKRLAGTEELQKQIEAGWTEEEIRKSWQPDLDAYRNLRNQYLLYED
ncbi:DUF1343 domain-containing protein [Marinoscillum sp. MHG1-6]|uniref:exo-beta-N-acetylmuramidase NamZ family protein n=1 Tax=Marinoscillum sp. MHG1-6 TaxID=2959627 RepID=UPI002157268B|nr:DUF1343 domain-containing protein [Marinoscillum sp. MHG1-6]